MDAKINGAIWYAVFSETIDIVDHILEDAVLPFASRQSVIIDVSTEEKIVVRLACLCQTSKRQVQCFAGIQKD